MADAILQVSASQPPAESAKLIEAALARAPDQPVVLNAAGSHMMRGGDARRARELYERAIALDGSSKVLWLNLATACRSLGDSKAEGVALERALSAEPRYVPALLQKAELMERLDKPKAAATVYQAALDCVASGTPVTQQMAAALTRAQELVTANSRELETFLEQELAPLRQQHVGADQRRYDACRDVFLRKRRVYTHEPKGILFPYLPAIEFFRREDFPWLDTLEAATEDIAAEALAAFSGDRAGFKPYVDFSASTPMDQWASLNRSFDWSVYNLLEDGARLSAPLEKCPKTAAVLAQLPLCDIPGYAPGAYFSVLKPRTRLPAHTGTTNTRSIVHLPLVIPEGCGFRVGSQVRTWQKGKAWVFDDTIDHEAWNDSDQIRIVLIFDIWNPLLTAAERDLVRGFTLGLGRYYGADAPELSSR